MGVARWAVLWAALILLPCMPVFAQTVDDGDGASEAQYEGDGCISITTLSGNTTKETEPFGIGETTLRVIFETTALNNQGFNFTIISVSEANDFSTVDSTVARNGRDGVLEVPLEAGRYIVDANNSEQDYRIVVEALGGDEPCTPAPADDNDNGDNDDGGDVDNPDDVVPGTGVDKPLPKTGGVPLLFAAASLVLAAALVVRRTLAP